MSKADRQKKRDQRRHRYGKPSLPRAIGANDNVETANDNAVPLTIRGVTLTEGQAYRFADAEQKLASRDLAARRAGHAILDALDREIQARLNSREAEANLKELSALEALRGRIIGTSNFPGAKDAPRADRDGLETLMTAGSLTTTQHAAGLRFRADYELLDPEKGLTPPPIDQTRKIVRGGEGFAEKRAEREMFMRDLEAMIQEEDRSFRGALGRSEVEKVGRAVWVLREVAGKGSNLSSLSNSGSVQKRLSDALLVGLDCAAIAYGLE
ncbi:hypothetical protein [Brevundimonas sp. Root1279]|uniref:hypothetical protein n=1 Tax=Brevundimonas sp. Root1279 TaxID=1736443 RepID=UPI0006F73C06|nr:hypothetical protein [Brevundimonas sp. Root1279]KQW79729.1 hypothetical protein ASC65_14370 [Brevundimonas sp. Root1279]